jgi:hypothetical protein
MVNADQKLTPEECTHHPRWHDQLSGMTYFEVSFSIRLVVFADNSALVER